MTTAGLGLVEPALEPAAEGDLVVVGAAGDGRAAEGEHAVRAGSLVDRERLLVEETQLLGPGVPDRLAILLAADEERCRRVEADVGISVALVRLAEAGERQQPLDRDDQHDGDDDAEADEKELVADRGGGRRRHGWIV